MIALIQLIFSLVSLCLVSLFLSGLRKGSKKRFALRSVALGALVFASVSLSLAYRAVSLDSIFSLLSLAFGVFLLIGIIALHRFHKGDFDSKNTLLQKLAYGSFALLLIHILLQAVVLAGD